MGHDAVREEADGPAQQRPERPVDFRGGHEINDVQEDVDSHKDSHVEIECPNFSDTTACALVPTPIVRHRRRHENAVRLRRGAEGVKPPGHGPTVFAGSLREGYSDHAYFWRISVLSSLPTLVFSSAVSVRTRLGTAHFETTPLSACRWT